MGLFDLFSSDNERAAADNRIGGYNAGFGQASGAINQGLGDLRSSYGQAQQFYGGVAPTFATANRGYDAYADAAGANGLPGLDNARTNFMATPGIAEGLNMGLDQIDRRAASRGMLASGNTNLDTLKFGQDYASQKYGGYLAGLAPFSAAPGQQLGYAGAQAGLQTGMGDKSFQGGAMLGDLGWRQQTGIGDANAAAELAKDQSGANILSALFGGANLAGKAIGMGGFGPPTYNFGGGNRGY